MTTFYILSRCLRFGFTISFCFCREVILFTQSPFSHKIKHMLKHNQNLMVKLIWALDCFSVLGPQGWCYISFYLAIL